MTWQPDPQKRRIVCAAVLMYDKRNVSNSIKLISARHWDETMHVQHDQCGNAGDLSSQEQGFIDQFGTFHDRKAALIIARRHNQIKPEGKSGNPDSDELFSEDLY